MSTRAMRAALRLGGLLTLALIAMQGCSRREQVPSSDHLATRPVIYTTFYPTFYFAKVIGGDAVEVVNPCPCDEDPPFWAPAARVIADYQRADMVIIQGAGYEKWIDTVSLPENCLVDSTKALHDDLIHYPEAVTHSHGPAGAHSHAGVDANTWLDPINARAQAATIKAAMEAAFPKLKETFERGFAELDGQLQALDRELAELSNTHQGLSLACAHPTYGYLARRYGWNVVTFILDPTKPLDADVVRQIKDKLAGRNVKHMLWESEPADAVRAQIQRELELGSIVFNPCEALTPADLDSGANYVSVMKRNIADLKRLLNQ
jgi:zinc transport system substrate-binding protein